MRWFSRSKASAKSPDCKPAYRAGERIYCVGDVHGRADLLARLHGLIEEDASGFDGRMQVLYLGDYVDRGAQSREVIELLLTAPLAGFESVFLRGNHEQAMLDFMDYPEATAGWLRFGGRETLLSYGIEVGHIPLMKDVSRLAQELRDRLPASHLNFLEETLLSWRAGDYYFVHAGVRPGVDLEDQHFEDQLWIREEFIESVDYHGAVIVHGHTISDEAELLPNRIGIDTGAFHSGRLTGLVLEGSEQRLLQT